MKLETIKTSTTETFVQHGDVAIVVGRNRRTYCCASCVKSIKKSPIRGFLHSRLCVSL